MDPLGQMETGNSTSELGDLRQHFCREIKATGDEGHSEFLLAQDTGVAHSHVYYTRPWSRHLNLLLGQIAKHPYFYWEEDGTSFGGTKHSMRTVTAPDGPLKGLKSMDLGHGHSGQCLGTFLLTVGGWVEHLVC